MNINIERSPAQRLRMTWTIVGLLTIITMSAAWWRWLGGPAMDMHSEVCRKLVAVQVLQQAELSIQSRHQNLQAEYSNWKAEVDLLKSRTLAHENEGQFLKWIDDQANIHSLTLRDYRPGQRQVVGDYETRSVQLTTSGSYESICNFLSQVRNGPRMLRVTSLELIPRDKSGQNCSCTLYFLLFSQAVPPPTKQTGVINAT